MLESFVILGTLASLGAFLALGHLAERMAQLRWLVYVALVAFDLNMAMLGVGLLIVASGAETRGGPADLPPDPVLSAMSPAATPIGWALIAVAAVGLLVLLAPVRRLVARLVPLDAGRIVHTIGLHLALLTVAFAVVVAAIMPLVAESEALGELVGEVSAEANLEALWAQAAGFVVIALLGVGLGVIRSWRSAMERLGLTPRVHVGWWLAATAVCLASGLAVEAVWRMWQPQSLEEVGRLSEMLFGPYIERGLAGALTIGLSAGIGEEILFRGAAQPRFGLVLTSLLFTAVHTQYTVSPALVQVLVLALLLGVVRERINTTTSIAVHSSYNFALVMLAIYAPELSP